MKLAWITDIHLNFVDFDARQRFHQSITDSNSDAVLISGDIERRAIKSVTRGDVERREHYIPHRHELADSAKGSIAAFTVSLFLQSVSQQNSHAWGSNLLRSALIFCPQAA